VTDSISFDRIAARYEETRGGLERGRRFAAALHEHLAPGSRVVEIGVGTAAVARPLAELGHDVVGVDISTEMLALGRSRLPGRLARADATALPFADASADAVVAVWAVHVIGDQEALAAAVTRVLRPGGRLLVVSATPEVEHNDLTRIAYRFGPELRPVVDRVEQLAPRLAPHGFVPVAEAVTDVYTAVESPSQRAAMIEQRDWSSLWELDDETWARVIQPVIDDLRALPEPDRPRHCVHRHLLAAFALDGANRR
jgi:ubiquinone/menaquinone biosynthesis C-methylase UbiE